MKDTLGGLADANVTFYKGMVETWEKMLKDLDEDEHPPS
jgi:sorting nexin-4